MWVHKGGICFWNARHGVNTPSLVFNITLYHVMCQYSWQIFRVDSLDKLKTKLSSLESEVLREPEKFRDLYIFSFSYAKNPNQKGIELEMAIPYWNILLQGRFPLLPLWTQFLQVRMKRCNRCDLCHFYRFYCFIGAAQEVDSTWYLGPPLGFLSNHYIRSE